MTGLILNSATRDGRPEGGLASVRPTRPSARRAPPAKNAA